MCRLKFRLVVYLALTALGPAPMCRAESDSDPALVSTSVAAATSGPLTKGPDVVLAWNQVMIDANGQDSRLANPDQGGPTRTSRAYAIVAAAMFDAWNSIHHKYQPYLSEFRAYDEADERAAISSAAYETLRALYPQQQATFAATFANWLRQIPSGTRRALGVQLGRRVALAILTARANDGASAPMTYTPTNAPGFHQVDPLHPNQGFLGPGWGQVKPFVLTNIAGYRSPPPPALNSEEYADAYMELLLYGGDGLNSPTIRTADQTVTGIFWAYDGTPGLGKPPRLYNQIVRVIAQDRKNSVEQNARLFALVNLAMADAGVQAWETKYYYELWRPVVAIRAGNQDGNPETPGVPGWTPLGAPATNGFDDGVNFTPPFPAYTSGHATFGAASLWTVAKFYGTQRIGFRFTSDEFNGINTNGDGTPRPVVTRRYKGLNQAILENALSRIYLGIHWSFDAEEGIASGQKIAEDVVARALQPRRRR